MKMKMPFFQVKAKERRRTKEEEKKAHNGTAASCINDIVISSWELMQYSNDDYRLCFAFVQTCFCFLRSLFPFINYFRIDGENTGIQ